MYMCICALLVTLIRYLALDEVELTQLFRHWSCWLFGESSGVGRLCYCWYSFWSCKWCLL